MSTDPRAAGPRPARGVLLGVLALLLALAVALPQAGSARADDAAAENPGKPSPGETIAQALRKSPVYVDSGYQQALPPAEQRKLVSRIKKTGIPIRVIIVPFVSGDAWGGDAEKMVDVVRDRLGESTKKEAVYITLSDASGSDFLDGFEFPRDKHQAFWGVSAVGHQEDMDGKPLGIRLSRAVDIVASGHGLKTYEKATADLKDDDEPDPGKSDGSSPVVLVLVIAGSVLVLGLLAVGFVLWRRRSAVSVREPFAPPASVFTSAKDADERDLRAQAHDDVVALGERLSAYESEETVDPAALQLALDAYAAAGTVLDEARGIPDLAGVLALVEEGRQALGRADGTAATGPGPARKNANKKSPGKTGTGKGGPGKAGAGKGGRKAKDGDRIPVCFFQPLHGRADGWIRWRPLGRRESLHVAACDACTRAVRDHRAPEALTDVHEGRVVPYFEVPAAQSLWAATGYGSLGSEPLTSRVTRGDFSRAATARTDED